MKLFNKLSVISLVVLMFSFMNVAIAEDCRGNPVNFCNASKTASDCANTFRPAAPTKQCAWDSSTSTCRANGYACYGPVCDTTDDCPARYQCSVAANGVSACTSAVSGN
jgi:hypothetical protein